VLLLLLRDGRLVEGAERRPVGPRLLSEALRLWRPLLFLLLLPVFALTLRVWLIIAALGLSFALSSAFAAVVPARTFLVIFVVRVGWRLVIRE
jgi:hypothetical protein